MANLPSEGNDRVAIAKEAGLPRLSIASALAGALTGYGGAGILATIAFTVIAARHVDTRLTSNDWSGPGAVIGLGAVLGSLIAFLFGGYVAGRMARRAWLMHGIGTFVLAVIAATILIATVASYADDTGFTGNLRNAGWPSSFDQVTGMAAVMAGLVAGAMLFGSLVGANLGEHWHTKLARRVADPAIGPAADAQLAAERERQDRIDLLERDNTVVPKTFETDEIDLRPGPPVETEVEADSSSPNHA
jgi:MFS family permease